MDKTKVEIALYTLSIVSMISGVMIYLAIKFIIKGFRDYRNMFRYPSLVQLSSQFLEHNMTCKPHEWFKTKLALRGLDPGQYLVCLKCGFVSGHSYKLNGPGIEVLRNNIKLKREYDEKEQRQIDRTKQILDADFNYWAKTYLQGFGKSPEENLRLLKKFSVFTVESCADAAKRAIQESQEE